MWMRARVFAGERFTPPSLSDSEPERDRSPIRSPSTSRDSYPEDYLPPTPGRNIPELERVNNPSTSGLAETLPNIHNRDSSEDVNPVDDTMAANSEIPMDIAGPSSGKRTSDDPVSGI